MTSSPLWQTTVSIALAGTDRQPFQLSSATGSVELLISQLDPTQPEAALLSTAGCLHLVELAGQKPLPVNALPDPADPEDQALCSADSAQFLSQMLEGQYPEFLPEWLQAAQARNLRVPAVKLPALLNWGSKKAVVQESIRAVVGKRGRWLAAQNPEWSYLKEPDPQSTALSLWETGSRAERSQWLQQLRHSDPSRARELLSATWKQDPAADRAAFLEVLSINLSLADEPFLESALDDRSKEVRHLAIRLLNTLPGSRLIQRMTERIRAFVNWRNQTLEVTLPEVTAIDQAAQRDGIEIDSPKKGLADVGERSGWLVKMIAAVPLDHWIQLTQQTPHQLIERVIKPAQPTDSSQVLIRGWVLATERQGDPVWAEALLNGWIRGEFPIHSGQGQLLALLPIDQQLEFLSRHWVTPPAWMTLSEWLRWFGSGCPTPWSVAFSDQLLGNLVSLLKQDSHPWTATVLQDFLQACVHLIPIESSAWKPFVESLRSWIQPLIRSSQEDLDRIPPRDQAYWQKWQEHREQEQRERILSHFLSQMTFRREMLKAFG